MNIWSEWQDSLSLLYPANIKLFLLVTLNTLRQTFVVWVRYYWSLILLYSIFTAYAVSPGLGKDIDYLVNGLLFWSVLVAVVHRKFFVWLGYNLLVLFLCLWLSFLKWISVGILKLTNVETFDVFFITIGALVLLVGFIIAMRPSVGLKNYQYFDQYVFHSMISVALLYGIMQLYGTIYSPDYAVSTLILFMIMAVVSLFSIMFFLDGKVSIKNVLCSIYRALKMFFYNLPFICISLLLGFALFLAVGILFIAAVYGLGLLANTAMYHRVSNGLINVVFPFYHVCAALCGICFFGNLYVKKSQEQYKLYFDK
ncbi:MAG TPA: hypothetical protein VGT41_02140 [Candidatus Babeliales bacterium]|nr:hypothetical protein [Candidatus Babeliales bacterium]